MPGPRLMCGRPRLGTSCSSAYLMHERRKVKVNSSTRNLPRCKVVFELRSPMTCSPSHGSLFADRLSNGSREVRVRVGGPRPSSASANHICSSQHLPSNQGSQCASGCSCLSNQLSFRCQGLPIADGNEGSPIVRMLPRRVPHHRFLCCPQRPRATFPFQ